MPSRRLHGVVVDRRLKAGFISGGAPAYRRRVIVGGRAFPVGGKMTLFDLTEFFKLSSALHYNLSAASLNRYTVLMYIVGDKRLAADDKRDREYKGVLMEALGYLFSAYSNKRRRLGPMAVLHPLRSAAIFTRFFNEFNLVNLLTSDRRLAFVPPTTLKLDISRFKGLFDQANYLLDILRSL